MEASLFARIIRYLPTELEGVWRTFALVSGVTAVILVIFPFFWLRMGTAAFLFTFSLFTIGLWVTAGTRRSRTWFEQELSKWDQDRDRYFPVEYSDHQRRLFLKFNDRRPNVSLDSKAQLFLLDLAVYYGKHFLDWGLECEDRKSAATLLIERVGAVYFRSRLRAAYVLGRLIAADPTGRASKLVRDAIEQPPDQEAGHLLDLAASGRVYEGLEDWTRAEDRRTRHEVAEVLGQIREDERAASPSVAPSL